MYTNLFNKLFQNFLDKNSFLLLNSRIKNYTINSYDFSNISYILSNEEILLNNMILNDSKNFNDIRNELNNKIIKNNITSIYCLLFNECVNINNEPQQNKLICSALQNYLSNILEEINKQLLFSLEDKSPNNNNYHKSQKNKKNKKDLKITIELFFLIFVFMINKYKHIIDSTDNNYMIKGININNLNTTKIKEELYLILIIQQNLYWIEIVADFLLDIFQKLKSNKFRLLINADNEFNNIDDSFKLSCFYCLIPLFHVIKKYSTLKVNYNLSHCSIIEYLFDINSHFKITNKDGFLPLKIKEIDRVLFKLFECFIYEFLYDIDSLWKYFDSLKYSISDKSLDNNSQIMLYGFGIYLCDFIKSIAFIRNDNLTKIDFFNFYIFSYNLITNYFSKLNNHLFYLFTAVYDIIKNNYIFPSSNINLNYLQNLSNTLKDMIFHFMVFSFYNDTLKDIYSYNEILVNAIISHCFFKTIIPIYSLIINGNTESILVDILYILISNINKYKIILPLKSHFHKELFTHNFLLILDYFLNKYEKELTYFLKNKINDKVIIKINNLKNIFNNNLSCLFDHYNVINFIYSNHIILIFNKILNNSGFSKESNLNKIILRYIPDDKNYLNYNDINLNIITYKDNNLNNNYNYIDCSHPLNINNINIFHNIFSNYNNNRAYVGYSLDNNFDKNTIQLLSQIKLEGYEFTIINEKNYLMKNNIEKSNYNYSNILANNGEFIEIIGIDKNLKEDILKIMENIQYTDKFMFKLIQEKIIGDENRNIKVTPNFNNNFKYYDLKFKMDFFEYQNQLKQLLL